MDTTPAEVALLEVVNIFGYDIQTEELIDGSAILQRHMDEQASVLRRKLDAMRFTVEYAMQMAGDGKQIQHYLRTSLKTQTDEGEDLLQTGGAAVQAEEA